MATAPAKVPFSFARPETHFRHRREISASRSKADATASLAGHGPALPVIVAQLWFLTLGPP